MTAYEAWFVDLSDDITYCDYVVQPWTPDVYAAARLISAWETSLSINGGAASTDDNDVTLAVSAEVEGAPASEMSFSNDGVDWSAWQPYAATKAWELDPVSDEEPHTRTVYARFKE